MADLPTDRNRAPSPVVETQGLCGARTMSALDIGTRNERECIPASQWMSRLGRRAPRLPPSLFGPSFGTGEPVHPPAAGRGARRPCPWPARGAPSGVVTPSATSVAPVTAEKKTSVAAPSSSSSASRATAAPSRSVAPRRRCHARSERARHLHDNVFDLVAVEVGAAYDDHLFGPAGEVKLALMDKPEVPLVEPAVADKGLGAHTTEEQRLIGFERAFFE